MAIKLIIYSFYLYPDEGGLQQKGNGILGGDLIHFEITNVMGSWEFEVCVGAYCTHLPKKGIQLAVATIGGLILLRFLI